jgi:hypothetical protein
VTDAAPLELWRDGWRTYRPGALHQLDCGHLRPVEGQIGALVELLELLEEREDGQSVLGGAGKEAALVQQWLRMAAGLAQVIVDLRSFDVPFMCDSAMEYEEAANRAASLFVTEYTRLLYVWNAAEVLLGSMSLPEVSGAKGVFNGAAAHLTEHWSQALPSHYSGLLSHLEDHIQRDPALAGDQRLRRSMKERTWRGPQATLLSASQHLRHVLAHGALQMPGPDAWGDEVNDGEEPIRLGRLHVPRLATRGICLGLQMILATRVDPASTVPTDELRYHWNEDLWETTDPVGLRWLLENAHLSASGFGQASSTD